VLGAASRASIERKLRQVSEQLRQLQDELRVTDEQLQELADAADEARLRALVSETPLSGEDHRQAERHAQAMRRHRTHVLDDIDRLEHTQDELLDRLVGSRTDRE
jgi:phage I-like protein